MLPFCSDNLKEFIIKWNIKFPIDRWFREKYKIPFNSSTHRQLCLIDIYAEYMEYYLFNYMPYKRKLEEKNKEQESEDIYIKGEGNFMKPIKITQKDIDRAFDELNIDEID